MSPRAASAQPRVLVVEDDRKTAELVALYLRHAGHRVVVEHDGAAAERRLRTERFDLLVVDLMLPGTDGMTLCRQVREGSETPIIILTARTAEEDRVAGLELGADDYVVKPFSPRELVARVAALLRRTPPGAADTLRLGDLVVDRAGHRVRVAERTVDLTPSEFALCEALLERPGAALTRRYLLGRLPTRSWDTSDRTVDAHVRNLRRKIGDDPADPRYIETVVGVGYRLRPTVPDRP